MPLSSSEEFTDRELSRDDEYPNKTPIEEVMEICQSDDESGKSTVITESSKSNVVNDNIMKDSTSSCDNETRESHNILELDPPKISTSSECTSQPHQNVDKISPNVPDADNVESCSEAYFKCLGQLRNCSKKITNLVSSSTNGSVIHYKSAFSKVKELCKEILATTQETQNLAEIQLQEIASIPDEQLGFNTNQDILVEHDPGRRPENLTDAQVGYLHVDLSCQHIQRKLI